MTIFISSINPASDNEWDFIWENCDYATYFHSREWARIWQAYHNGAIYSVPKLVSFSDGKKALLPFSAQKIVKSLTRGIISSPGATYGGWISKDNLTREHAVLLADYIVKKYCNIYWRINPYDELVVGSGIKLTLEDETQALNLLPGFERVYKGWTKGHRSAVTKARNSGVSVKLALSEADWNVYYAIYLDSVQRWGGRASAVYEKKMFLEMLRRPSSNIKLWLGVYEDKPIAGCLCFYAKRHVVYWHGAALDKYFILRPVNLVLYEAIKEACEKEYQWFDFNPSGGLKGVISFKKSFGCQVRACGVYISESCVVKAAHKASMLTRRILRPGSKK